MKIILVSSCILIFLLSLSFAHDQGHSSNEENKHEHTYKSHKDF
jgi:hypothetical protein